MDVFSERTRPEISEAVSACAGALGRTNEAIVNTMTAAVALRVLIGPDVGARWGYRSAPGEGTAGKAARLGGRGQIRGLWKLTRTSERENRWWIAVLLALLSACSGASPVVSRAAPPWFIERDLIDIGSPNDARVIATPSFEPASSATWLGHKSAVVVLLGERIARAYPVAILMRHEVIDDVIEGLPVAVTYFPLADAVAVWERSDGQRPLTLRPSGKAYRSDSVLYDLQTRSLWPQASGIAVLGPMKGVRLRLVPSLLASFGAFRDAFPNGEVLARPNPAADYDLNPYAGYDRRAGPPQSLFLSRADRRAPPMQRVVGFLNAAGYPTTFRSPPTAGFQADDIIAITEKGVASPLDAGKVSLGRPLEVTNLFKQRRGEPMTRDEQGRIVHAKTGSVFSSLGIAVDGELKGARLSPVPQVHAMWFAWQSFNEDRALN